MQNEELQYEYYEHITPYNILVVSNDGELINVLCPFQVRAKSAFPEIKINEIVWVQKVQTIDSQKNVFIINDNAYLVNYFQIILNT